MSLPRIAILTMIYALIMGCSDNGTDEVIQEQISLVSNQEQSEIVSFLYKKASTIQQSGDGIWNKQIFCKQEKYILDKYEFSKQLEFMKTKDISIENKFDEAYLKFLESKIFDTIQDQDLVIPEISDQYPLCSDDFNREFLDNENLFYKYHTITLSPPIRSGDYIFIENDTYCGPLCASGELLVLNQDSLGNWQIIETIGLWIS